MKKYLFIALAALGFAACAEKGEENGPVQNAELEQSYVAVTFAADDMTRATNGNEYAEGSAEERAVKSAHVFFFEDGVAFPVTFDGTTSTNAGTQNYITVDLKGNKEDMDNVSDVKDAVLVLQKYKGEYPNQVIAVLNWTPVKAAYSLDELKAEISTLKGFEKGFVMSNAVYANGNNEVVNAVALTEANIAKTADEALMNPITIHVERVAAKVEFTSVDNGKFKVGKVEDTVDNETTTVYAQIKGFELYNDYETSYLIKRIDPTWNGLGFNWNDADWFRSYWATSLDTKFPENTFTWSSDNTEIGGYVYCGENTREWTAANDVRTKVIVKAQLVKEDGTPVEVVNWWGKEYVGKENLLKVVANTLKNTYFTSTDGVNFTGLAPEDIKSVGRDPKTKNAYEVYFVISDSSKSKHWYKYEQGKYNAITVEDLNKELVEVQPAHVYTNGMTYYWLDIKHLGAEGKTAEYGIVRNHVYRVNITSITGYGTPVYDGNTAYLTPEKPVDINSFVSAQINILSWRVVEDDYDLK